MPATVLLSGLVILFKMDRVGVEEMNLMDAHVVTFSSDMYSTDVYKRQLENSRTYLSAPRRNTYLLGQLNNTLLCLRMFRNCVTVYLSVG